MRRSFLASYPGRCANCGDMFEVDDEVFYDADDALRGEACCGDHGAPDAVRGTAETLAAPIERVMPRGASAQDRCDRCFQIPSSNGVCGCS